MNEEISQVWRKCGVCKKGINFQSIYQKCSISSCKKFAFCSVNCWSVHESVMSHKSAYAEEELAPTALTIERPSRRIIPTKKSTSSASKDLPKETLIVVSKMKNYVKARSDMNTSADVADVLSDYVRVILDMALENTKNEGRKTLMGKDFHNIKV